MHELMGPLVLFAAVMCLPPGPNVILVVSVTIWAGFGTMIGRYLRNPRTRAAFNWSISGLLVLSLIPVYW
jgi:threonine/homoserine/homoserine lactone efflux protein